MERAYLIPQLMEPVELGEYRDICVNCSESNQNRRKNARASVCFFVCYRHPDLIQLGGIAYNLSLGGLAIKTNYPICKGEWLIVEFFEPDTLIPMRMEGQVAWRQFHGDTPGKEETLFTAGIRFQSLEEPVRTAILESIQNVSA